MSWLIVHNPAAGRPEDVGPRLRAKLDELDVRAEIHVSESAAHVAEIVHEGVAGGMRRFAAVGGDGTAHLVANALLAHDWQVPPVLAIVAAGSGSDFIRTFALPRTLEESVALLATDDVYRTDVGLAEGAFGRRFFLNAINFGVAAASAVRADSLPRRMGGLRYTTAFWLSLAGFRPGSVSVDTGRRVLEAQAMNVVVANGQFFGGGLNVAPQAAVMDGVLDVEIFVGPRRRAFTVMPRVIRGLHLRHPAVRVGRTASAEVVVPPHWPIEADGEFLGTGSARITVIPGALDFKI